MESNPYAPPKAPVEDLATIDGEPVAASVPLYTSRQMAVAAFLGTAMAGAWLAAANFKAVSQPLKARRALWLGVVVSIVSLGVAVLLPDDFPNLVIPLAIAFCLGRIAEAQFAGVLRAHKQAGGALRSWWRAVGIGLLVAVILLAVVFAVALAFTLAVGDLSL